MNRVIFVGFDTEEKAYEGDRALHDLHKDGTLTLYNDAVVVKEPTGNVAVRRPPEAEPFGTFGGMLTGGLIGLLGGPVGAASPPPAPHSYSCSRRPAPTRRAAISIKPR